MSKERKMFTLRVTENELFAITNLVNAAIEQDREPVFLARHVPLDAGERNALHGVIRKAEAAIDEHHAAVAWRKSHG